MFKLQQQLFKTLTDLSKFNIVYRYTPKRSWYDKTSYIDEYIPRQTKYHKSRKPPLPQWDDPNVEWPKLQPKPTQSRGQGLLLEIQREEKRKIEKKREFIMPLFRSGDVIQFHYVHSISEMKGNVLTGIVVGRTQKNSLMAGFKVIVRYCGVEVFMNIKQNSPNLRDLKLVHKGDGQHRAQLNWLWDNDYAVGDKTKLPLLKGGSKKRPPKRRAGEKSMISHRNVTKPRRGNEIIKDPLFEEEI